MDTFEDWIPVHNRTAHEHHSVPRYRSRGSVVDVVDLEYDLAVWRHRDSIAVRQGQGLVVVEHRVKILDPDGVDWAVQDEPHMLPLEARACQFMPRNGLISCSIDPHENNK